MLSMIMHRGIAPQVLFIFRWPLFLIGMDITIFEERVCSASVIEIAIMSPNARPPQALPATPSKKEIGWFSLLQSARE